jgi:hypothetical protein
MAANDLINVYDPTFWAQESLLNLFPMLKLAGMVYREFENQVAQQGDTVNTRLPNRFVAQDIDPDNFQSVKPTADNVAVKLSSWKGVVFEIGDKEASLAIKDLVTEFVQPAAFALAEAVEQSIIALHTGIYQNVGVAGTTPATVAALGTDIKQAMDQAFIPEQDRSVVLNSAAVNKFNQVFFMDYVSGSPDQQVTGLLRPKFGMMMTDSNLLTNHINGTAWIGTSTTNGIQIAPAPVNLGALPGASSINITGLQADGTINVGDLFTYGLSAPTADNTPQTPQSYTVLQATTANGSGQATVLVSPQLQQNTGASDPLTEIGTHAINLAFHKQAFALVTRPLRVPSAPGANVAVQSFNGIGLRSAVWYQPKDVRSYVRLDLLFGAQILDPRKAVRVLG